MKSTAMDTGMVSHNNYSTYVNVNAVSTLVTRLENFRV